MIFSPLVALQDRWLAEALYALLLRGADPRIWDGTAPGNLTILLGPADSAEPTHISMCAAEVPEFQTLWEQVAEGGPLPPSLVAALEGNMVFNEQSVRDFVARTPVYFGPSTDPRAQFLAWIGEHDLTMMGYAE